MNILPIQDITEVDQSLFGSNLLNLAKLKRGGLCVPAGIVITPPEILLNTVLKHLEKGNKEIFEQKLTIIKNEVSKIPVPDELEKKIKTHNTFFVNKKVIRKNKLWLSLLSMWLTQIRLRLWQDGFGSGISANLSAIPILFLARVDFIITAYFEPDNKEVVIKSSQKIAPHVLKQINEIVAEANKKLFIPQVYQFIVCSHKIYLTQVSPYTQSLPVSKTEDLVIPQKQQKQIFKSAIKLFVNLSSGFTTDTEVDGVLIEGESVEGFENKVFKLSQTALQCPLQPVIFKLPDICDNEKIRGTLRLLNQASLLDESCSAFLFARNKKNLYNLELAIPYMRSSDELLQMKRELAVREINRKGTLKFWMEICVPENFINMEGYLEAGIDGIILNLDELQKLLGGYDFSEGEFYKKNVAAVIKFITPYFKILHKNKIPFLVKGSLCIHPDMLDFLVEAGVWGIVANTAIEAEGLPEHLNWAEKRMVIKRLG